jgi:hypothetical protein
MVSQEAHQMNMSWRIQVGIGVATMAGFAAFGAACGGSVVVDTATHTSTETLTGTMTDTDTSTETLTGTSTETVTETDTSISCYECACSGSGNTCNAVCDSAVAGALNFCTAGMTGGMLCTACVAAACGESSLANCN